MRVTHRLARLEAALSPQQATLLWLADAQRFGSLTAYAASLLDEPASMLPLVAVPQQARRAVRGALRGQSRSVIAEREQEAFHEALFLVQLVIELERAAQSTLRRAETRWLVLWAERRSLDADGDKAPGPAAAWQRVFDDLLVTIARAKGARSLLERRYLAGQGALFPDTATAWQDVQEAVRLLIPGRHSRPSPTRDKARATREAAAIAESTQAACLAVVSDSQAAVGLIQKDGRGPAPRV